MKYYEGGKIKKKTTTNKTITYPQYKTHTTIKSLEYEKKDNLKIRWVGSR